MAEQLSWEAPYAIARALMRQYPQYPFEELSLSRLEDMVRGLEGFQDEPGPVNDELLLEIFQLWYEESLHGQS